MGWVQTVGNNHYWYEYRDGKNTYIGKCNKAGEIYEAEAGFEDRVTIPPPSEPAIQENDFYNLLMEKFATITEDEQRIEMVDIEHGEDYENLIVKQGDEYHLLIRPKEEVDQELLHQSIVQQKSMHELEEMEVEGKKFIILSSAWGEDEEEIIHAMKAEGREQGQHFHQVRMNRYLWGEEDVR